MLKNSNGKPDGFIKLLTKRISYIGLSELITCYNFYGFYLKITGLNLFSRCKENFLNL